MINRLCLSGVAVLMLQGCAAHLCNVASERKAPVIVNPIAGTILAKKDQSTDRILRESGIVREAPGRMVYLEEFEFAPQCGMPFLASAMTLGLIPADIPALARVEILTWSPGGKKERTTYLVRMTSRYSLWEGLAFWHDDELAKARALGWAYKEKRLAP